ncbi:hypothetical protein [Kitasatospora sp. CB01950]|uniref:hypothetical protein n=1 Tax=Kitasatospora sp. CB01950 TaxID=1703930 RepID=UPI000938FF12|nr:hypothetical protein [Kitasatospora sp. CB01950]OKJ17280.1 hypothetical protein AMK19_04195 [Kitasatospora sp. CB01950]
MTSRRRLRAVALLAGSTALLTGCGIRPTAVPVDAGAPASRTACPTSVLMPVAPATASVAPTPPAAPTASGKAKVPASPSPSPSAAPSEAASAPGVFGAPSASHCP